MVSSVQVSSDNKFSQFFDGIKESVARRMFPAVSSKTNPDGDSPASSREISWNVWRDNFKTPVDASLQDWDIGAKRKLKELLDGLHKAVGANISTHRSDIEAGAKYATETSIVESMSKAGNLTEPVDVTQAYREYRTGARGCSVPNNYRIYSIQLKDQPYQSDYGRHVYDENAKHNRLQEHLLIVSFDDKGNPSPTNFVNNSGVRDTETTFALSETDKLKHAIADQQLVEKALATPETTRFLEPLQLVQEFVTQLPEKLKQSRFFRAPNPDSNEYGPQYLDGNSPWLGRFLLGSLPDTLKSTQGMTVEQIAERIRIADTLSFSYKRQFNDNLSKVKKIEEAQKMTTQVVIALNACGFDAKFKPLLDAMAQNIVRFKREVSRR